MQPAPLFRCGGVRCSGPCAEHLRDEDLHRSSRTTAAPTAIPAAVHEELQRGGAPLDASTRSSMEARFGHDFSTVRVHADAPAAGSARSVNALAYTVGSHIVFDEGRYAPNTPDGRRLLVHELTHVVQQRSPDRRPRADRIVDADHPTEREAASVASGASAPSRASRAGAVHRAPGDLVQYQGGYAGLLMVWQGGAVKKASFAISGHAGHSEWEKNIGPIPTGTYTIHPQRTRPTVSKPQGGVCSARAITSGYQELTSKDPVPCADPPSHYCTEACPTAADPGRRCYTPVGCWGAKRMKVEGSVRLRDPSGKRVTRSAFYIHGGDPGVLVSSGCIKVLDDGVFDAMRALKGAVTLCVGKACDPLLPGATP